MSHTLSILAQAHGHAAEGESFLTEYLELLRSPAHFAFEWTNEAITGLILIPIWKRAKAKAVRQAIARHDAKFHPHSHQALDAEGKV